MATNNELVMSDEEIQAELGTNDESSADVNQEPEDEGNFSSWEDETSDVDGADATDANAAAVQPQTRTFKANGREVEVDMSDQEGVDRLITLGLGARPLFSKVDKLTKELSTAKQRLEAVGRYEKAWKKLDGLKSDHDALYEAVFGKKYDDAFKERKDWQDRYEAASPDVQRAMVDQRQNAVEAAKLKREREEWEASKGENETRAEEVDRKELRTQLLPEFHKNEFSSKIKDPVRAEKLNAMLWRQTISNLKGYDEITPDLIRKEFREVAALLAGDAKEAKQAVKKVVEEKKQVAKQQAKVAATRNYSGSSDKDLSKEKDPVKLMRRMFGRG